jgi:Prokaryotic RING finger family 1
MSKVAVQVLPRQRCPLCRDPVEDTARLVACDSCQTVYHRACSRELGGCSTLGCVQAGGRQRVGDPQRHAQPNHAKAPLPRPQRPSQVRRSYLAACVILSWLLFPLFFVSWPVLAGLTLLAAGEGGRAQRPNLGRLLGAALTSLVLVPTLCFLAGAGSYAAGTARLEGSGLPGYGYGNLHPELRCYRRSAGCCKMGYEPLTQGPNNLAVWGLSKALGPQPGAYAGPYPSPERARDLLAAQGEDVGREEFLRGRFTVQGRELSLNRGVAQDLYDSNQWTRTRARRVLLLEDDRGACLLVSTVEQDRDEDEWFEREYLLLDLEQGEVFARYRVLPADYELQDLDSPR